MDKKRYTWYIEPLNKETNDAIYEYLSKTGLEFSAEPILCADGKKHNLWECPLNLIPLLCGNKKSLQLRFVVWGKQGRYGRVINKLFLFVPKKKYRKKEPKKTAR